MIRALLILCSLASAVTRTHQDLIDLVGRKGDITHLYDLYNRAGWVTPQEYGANASDTLDDSQAIRAACAAVQAEGGGGVFFPSGTYYTTGTATLCSLSTVRGFTAFGHGAKIKANRTYTSGQYTRIFRFSRSKNITLDGIEIESPEEAVGSRDDRGVIFAFFEKGCENIRATNIYQTGGIFTFQFYRAGTDSSSWSSRNIYLCNIRTSSVGYPLNCQFSGDNLTADDFYTVGAHRSYFPYGVRNHRVTVISKDQDADDALIACFENGTTEGIDLSYTNVSSATAQSAAPGVSVAFGDTTPCLIRNLTLRLTMKYPTSGYFGAGVHFYKHNTAGAYDTVARGHRLENVLISGSIEGNPGPGNSPPFTWSGTWGAGDTVRAFAVRDLRLINTATASLSLQSLEGQATFQNINSSGNFNVTGNNTRSKLVFTGVKAPNLTGSTADTSYADYYSCDITSGSSQSTTNKGFYGTFLASVLKPVQNNGILFTYGSGTPEGALTAPVGSLYQRTNGGASTSIYVKESGTGNTGWVAK